MGYFAAMTRQTGITFGSAPQNPVPAVRRIDVSESRTTEVSAAASNSAAVPSLPQPMNSSHVISETRVGSTCMSAPRSWEDRREFTNPSHIVEVPSGESESGREFIVTVNTLDPSVKLKSDQKVPEPALPTVEMNSKPSPEKAGDQQEASRGQARPTMAEVRAWVAEPLKQLAELQARQIAPERPVLTPEIDARESVERQLEAYSLEIGTLEIVIDAPPASHPHPRPQVAAPAEQPRAQWNRASRHYLRF
jgi:hypothetical protein